VRQTAAPQVSKKEFDRRVAILKRFRELLVQQRDRFQNYLVVLDKQKDSIESANTEDLLTQVDLEEQIVADIFSIQKVIDPLEKMYNASAEFQSDEPEVRGTPDDVPALKTALEDLKSQVIARSSRNRDLLSARMTEVRSEITSLRNSPFTAGKRRSVYQNSNAASLVDIKG